MIIQSISRMQLALLLILFLIAINNATFANLTPDIRSQEELFIKSLNFPIHYPQIFYEQFSFNNDDWYSIDRMLLKAHNLCLKNTTWFRSWTKPIKCSYYLVIIALHEARKLKVPDQLSPAERDQVEKFIDVIYGPKNGEKYNVKFKETVTTPTSLSAPYKSSIANILQDEDISICIEHVDSIDSHQEKRVALILPLTLESLGVQINSEEVITVNESYLQNFNHFLETTIRLTKADVSNVLVVDNESDGYKRGNWELGVGVYLGFQHSHHDHPSIQSIFQQVGNLLTQLPAIQYFQTFQIRLFPKVAPQAKTFSESQAWLHHHHAIELPYFFTNIQYELIQSAMQEEYEYFSFLMNSSVFTSPAAVEDTESPSRSTGDTVNWVRSHITQLCDTNEIFPNFGIAVTPLTLRRAEEEEEDKVAEEVEVLPIAETFATPPSSIKKTSLNYAFTLHKQHFHMIETMKKSRAFWKLLQALQSEESSVLVTDDVPDSPILFLSKDDTAKIYLSALIEMYEKFQKVGVPREDNNNSPPFSLLSDDILLDVKAQYRVIIERFRRYIAQYLHLHEDYRTYHSCLLEMMSLQDESWLKSSGEKKVGDAMSDFSTFFWRLSQL